MNSSSSMQNLQNLTKVRYGLMKIYIGTDHVIKGPDGVNRQFRVKDKAKYPKLDTVCVCLKCGKSWPSEEELLAAHPENRVMKKQEEAHIYGWWSDKLLVEEVKTEKKDEKNEKKDKDFSKVIGLLSDEEMPST